MTGTAGHGGPSSGRAPARSADVPGLTPPPPAPRDDVLVARLLDRGVVTASRVDEQARATARVVHGVLDLAARIHRAKVRERAAGIR